MRVLVVGCGSIGQRHARLLNARADVEVAVCDVLEENLEAASQHAGCTERYRRLEEALACPFEAAVVATPNDSHAAVAVAALRAGLDVLLEKPMADTVAAAETIAEAADTTGRLLMVAYNMRHHPGLREMKRIVDKGRIGRLVGGRAMVGSYYTLMCARTPFRLTEKGILAVDASHELDFLRWFFGDVVEVSARTARTGDLEMKPDPNLAAALLTYRSGAIVGVHMDYVQHPQRRIFEVYGDAGTLVLDFQTSVLEEYHPAEEGHRRRFFPHHRDAYYIDEHDAFFEAMRTRVSPIAAEDGLGALRVCEAILRSAQERTPVPLQQEGSA